VTTVGAPADLGLYAVSDSGSDQYMGAANIILSWNPTYLDLLGLDQTGASPDVLAAAFAPEPYGLNESNPPADGDGWIEVLAGFGPTGITATPAGTLLTTILLDALAETPLTTVSILPSGGFNQVLGPGHTTVFDAFTPGLDVTGTLGSADITIVPEPATLCLAFLGFAAAGFRRRARHA
jgi:hypothetical protein